MTLLSGPSPASNEFEISLFGCGVGESIALHLGQGEWAIVDSCRSGGDDDPLPLKYLRGLGLDPSKCVKLIVLTHWHDDHVDGAADLVSECPAARVACSAAMESDELATILGLYSGENRIVDRRTSGVREFSAVYKVIQQRLSRADSSQALIRTQADHLIYRTDQCKVVALSPSPGSIARAHREIARLLDNLLSSDELLEVPTAARNDYSVALWVCWGEMRALLGGDLEVERDRGRGWEAVLRCAHFPDNRARFVKIAHHGSPNGDSIDVWQQLIEEEHPIAALTSYMKGPRPLPSKDDLNRICAHTKYVYCTSPVSTGEPARDRAVKRRMDGAAKKRRVLRRTEGQIRIRVVEGNEPMVDLAGAAQQS